MKKLFLLAFLALFMIRATAQPSSAAAPPTADAGTVLSLLGSHYSNASNASGTGIWFPNWGQQTQVAYSNIGGSDTTIRYSNLNYQGVQFNGAVNASGMDSIHFDIWSSNCSVVNFHLIWGSESGPNVNLNSGSWTSVTLALNSTNFPNANFANIIQFKFTGVTPTSGSTIYLENVYFRQAAGKPVITGFSLPSQTAGTTYTITDPTSTSTGAFTYTSSNTAVATVSGNTLTYVAGGTCTITANQAASGSYQSGTATATLVVAFPSPSSAATPPTADAANVISVFGSHYTQNSFAAGTAVWHQGWGDATNVNYMKIGSDTTMKSTNFNYQGVQFSTALNVASMDSLHLDIWSPNVGKIYVDLIGGGESDHGYVLPLGLAAGWNSLNIPLSNYTPTVNLSSLLQFKFDITPNGSPYINSGGVVYYENIYFFKAAGKPTITGFTIPSQTYTGSNSTYTITNPTSNSNGTFSYSSSNTSVATVSGNTITILSAGTSIITATQAADITDGYAAGTASTTLTVGYATPTTAAAAPTISAPYVFSLFGDTYTNLASINWFPNWGQSTTYTATTVAGVSTIKYDNLNYEGINLPSDQNVSNFDSIRFNVWSPNCTSLKLGLIQTTGGTVQQFVTVTLTKNTWNTISIPVTSFSPVNLAKLNQISFTTVTPGSGAVIYLENIYFMNVVGKPTISGFSIPDQVVGASPYTITDPSSNSTGAFTYTSSNTAVATVSGHTLTIVGAGTSTITANEAADSNYLAGTATAVVTVDYAGPTTAAATPTNSSADVISLYGDTYTNVTGTSWNPNWGQPVAVVTSFPTIGSKSTLKYASLSYEGVQFASTIDASLMDTLHFDLWTPNCTNFSFYIINTATGANQNVTVTPTSGGWNSINLPMSSFSIEANHVDQFKIVANTPTSGGTLFLQNIYFFKTAGKPTISGFTLPSNLTTSSAPFTITTPTSNSAGAFTYTSGNTAIATISGNTVTIHAAGTAVITATQAADNVHGYVSGSITATLTVAYPGPTTAAPVPTSASGNVISLWGDTYTNVSGTTWNPYWGQPAPGITTSTITVGGKTTLEYQNLGYQGIQFASNINASTMKLLHFDLWTPNCTNLELYVINTSNGANQLVTITPTTYGWNSISIPMTNFSNEASSIGQFKLVSNSPASGAVLYFQNIYFDNATPTATWAGTTSTDYSIATNWAYGIAPASTSIISIPSAPANQPALSSDLAISNNVVLNGSLDLNGHSLSLSGSVTGSGSLKGSATSSLSISGSVGTVNFNASSNTLQNLSIFNGGSLTLGNTLNLVGLLSSNGGTLNTGGYLNLKSTSIANTAVVGPVSGTINGTTTVERYIPQNLVAFRDLSAGGVANAGYFFNNWQEAGARVAGKGIYITGKKGTTSGVDAATGFDITISGSPSLYAYGAGTWPAVTNTKTTSIDPYQGYRVVVKGDRNVANYGTTSISNTNMYSATAIRTTGNLITGNVTYSTTGVANTNYPSSATTLVAGSGNYSLIANPYACPIDWELVYGNAGTQNVTSSYWYFDPTFMSNGYATYVSYNAVSHVNSNGASKLNKYIQPGMAFFIQNSNTSSPVLAITENNKVAGSTKTAVFRTMAPNYINVSLWKIINGESTNIDGTVAVFNSEFTKVIGDKDSKKLTNGGENLYIVQNNTDLSIAGLPTPTTTDEISLNLSQIVAGISYQLKVDVSQFTSNGLDVFIKDNLLNTVTPASEGISFTATKDAATYEGRFSVVFKKPSLLPVFVKGSVSVYPNPVSNNKINVQMNNLEKGTYTVKVINNLGQEVLNSTISNESGESIKTIVAKGLTTGLYTLQVIGKTSSYTSEMIVK